MLFVSETDQLFFTNELEMTPLCLTIERWTGGVWPDIFSAHPVVLRLRFVALSRVASDEDCFERRWKDTRKKF
ncbi:hypothetical protein L596_026256 [Steinernema carpocapsae]|uniref:Uncharacterized protein n=1 Tax=Steinernema carpocapsae TaxID=34508 RepID=A0A4U5M0T4_STECR|nr:hypothetical protein L596_026256 [Steinernema carpocapsae]